jgi:hypothetical protein
LKITAVEIDSGVTSIGACAFKDVNLTSIIIGNDVTKIGNNAFTRCKGLTSVTIPNSVDSIGSSVFYGCTNITSVTIGNSVSTIENSAFADCSNLTSITIPKSVVSIGNYAFYQCVGLKKLIIEDGKNPLAFYYTAYNAAQATTNVFNSVPLDTLYLGRNISYRNTYTTYNISVDISPFYQSSVKYITCGDSLTSIRNVIFSGCSELTSIAISQSVTSIGSGAFSGCSKLTDVNIPNSVTSIGNSAFNCINLISLTLPLKSVSGGALGSIFYSTSSNTSISGYTQQGIFGNYYYYVPLSLKSITIIDNTDIPANFFQNTNLETAEIPLVKNIGASAFSGSKLTSIEIPDNIISIGSNAFANCPLKTVTTPVVASGLGLFPASLEKLTVTAACTAIPANIFSGCNNLQDLTLPFIGTSPTAPTTLSALFGGTVPTTLKKLALTRAAKNISLADAALSGCSMLEELTLASTVQSLGENALYGCSGLRKIYSHWAYPPAAYNNSTFQGMVKVACEIYVPSGSKKYYSVADGWKEFYSPVDNIFEKELVIALSIPRYGGEIKPTGTDNDNVTLNAIGNIGYTFAGWIEDNHSLGNANPLNITATSQRTIYALFTPDENADENIVINKTAVSASMSWVAVQDATNYTLIIYSDENRTDTVAVFQLDANGQILATQSAASPLRAAQQNLSCNIPNLSAETQYFYSLTSYDSDNFTLTMSVGDFTTLAGTAIDEVATERNIRIYPNPVKDVLHIDIPFFEKMEYLNAQIFDVSGRIVNIPFFKKMEYLSSINVSHLPSGVYFLKIGDRTARFVKE